MRIGNLSDIEPINRVLSEIERELNSPGSIAWDEHFMELSKRVSKRANCKYSRCCSPPNSHPLTRMPAHGRRIGMKRQAGAVVTRDKRIVSTGYNGTARNSTNCSKGGCYRCLLCAPKGTLLEGCFCLHAEQNALLEVGHSTLGNGALIYCTSFPCMGCAKIIVQCGVRRIVYEYPYADDEQTLRYIRQHNIEVVRLHRGSGTGESKVEPATGRASDG